MIFIYFNFIILIPGHCNGIKYLPNNLQLHVYSYSMSALVDKLDLSITLPIACIVVSGHQMFLELISINAV